MIWYIALYVVGVIAAILSPQKAVEEILTFVQPIALTALVASLLVPFAAFSKTEWWQKWLVQYAIIPLFGMYTVLVWRMGTVVGVVILLGAAAVHVGYWMSSLHSRGYRLKMFEFGFARDMPATSRLIARLNGTGNSHIADEIVQAILRGESVPSDVWGRAEKIVGEETVRVAKEENKTTV